MQKADPDHDVYGQALFDYYTLGKASPLYLNTSYGKVEKMPVDWFFRDEEDFPELERMALDSCSGDILDIGAGVGSHAIYLYEEGKEVWALDNSTYCIEIMKLRGLTRLLHQPLEQALPQTFDTLLLLMNGIGIVQTLEGLRKFLQQAHNWIKAGGQIIFDSSDLSYLYDDIKLQHYPYKGEIQYQYMYKKLKGDWFTWLYVDQQTMKKYAEEADWKVQILLEDHNDQYLAKLTKS